MTIQGTSISIFLWAEAEIETNTQTSGVKLIGLNPGGSAINIFFMTPRKLDEMIEKLQLLKGGE